MLVGVLQKYFIHHERHERLAFDWVFNQRIAIEWKFRTSACLVHCVCLWILFIFCWNVITVGMCADQASLEFEKGCSTYLRWLEIVFISLNEFCKFSSWYSSVQSYKYEIYHGNEIDIIDSFDYALVTWNPHYPPHPGETWGNRQLTGKKRKSPPLMGRIFRWSPN